MPNEHIVERRTPSVVSLRSKNFLTPILATLNGVVGRPTEKHSIETRGKYNENRVSNGRKFLLKGLQLFGVARRLFC